MNELEKDTATRKFTDMDATALRASMGPTARPTPPSSRRRCPTTSTSS